MVFCRLVKTLLFVIPVVLSYPARADSVYTEDMTWMEIRDKMQAGYTTIIVPTGGTEQNGPQMVVGKHNIIVRHTAGEIARKLGNALVAPVIAYVPEGRINPPEGHMQFPGTISVSDDAFEALLEDTARSLKQHGFKTICFIGDHGGSQKVQQEVAEDLSDDWEDDGVRVIQVSDYYANNGQEAWTKTLGLGIDDPGAHAGIMDTSEAMALDKNAVRKALRGKRTKGDYQATGAMGDSSHASVEYGKQYLALKVNAAVRQIESIIKHNVK